MALHKFEIFFVLSALTCLSGCGSSEARAQSTPPPPEVTVANVITRPLPGFSEFTGRLEAAESVEVRPRVSGYVDSVHFTEGAPVKKGQLLFRIDPRPLKAEVDRLSAELERSRSQLELSRSNRDRGTQLFASHVISQESSERLNAEASAAQGALGAARASLEAARLNLSFTEVRSPIDGRVSRALIRPGNLVTGSSLLTTVVSTDPIHAYFDADEHTFLNLSRAADPSRDGALGERAANGAAVLLGLSNETGHPHQGTLDFLDNQLDPRTGTIRARATFRNPTGEFTPGLFVRLKLAVSETRPRVLIDDRAVGTDLGKRFVLVLKPDKTLDYRRVVLGAATDGLRVVDQGLDASDVIVVNGLSHVRPGMKVNPKFAPPGAPAADAAH